MDLYSRSIFENLADSMARADTAVASVNLQRTSETEKWFGALRFWLHELKTKIKDTDLLVVWAHLPGRSNPLLWRR